MNVILDPFEASGMSRHHRRGFDDKQLVERQCSFLQHLLLMVGFSRFLHNTCTPRQCKATLRYVSPSYKLLHALEKQKKARPLWMLHDANWHMLFAFKKAHVTPPLRPNYHTVPQCIYFLATISAHRRQWAEPCQQRYRVTVTFPHHKDLSHCSRSCIVRANYFFSATFLRSDLSRTRFSQQKSPPPPPTMRVSSSSIAASRQRPPSRPSLLRLSTVSFRAAPHRSHIMDKHFEKEVQEKITKKKLLFCVDRHNIYLTWGKRVDRKGEEELDER